MSNRQARPTGIAFTGWSSERFVLTQPRSLRWAGIAAVASILGVAGGLSGCASPAPPKPPTLNLPALATDIQAQRMGSQVRVRWTTSSQTFDQLPMKGPITAELCREVGPRPDTPAARLKACVPVARLVAPPGHSEATDDLPASLQADPVTLLTYRVQLFNAAGHSAGESAVAGFAAAGAAPPAVEDLHATNLEAGAVMEWQPSAQPGLVDLERTDLTPPPPHTATKPHPAPAAADQPAPTKNPTKKKKKKAKGKSAHSGAAPTNHSQKTPPEETLAVHLRVTEPATAPANAHPDGTVDATATMGSTYRYVANRVRSVTLGVHKLEIESAPSAPITFAHLDIFPPQPPTNLEAIPSSDPEHPAAIDLSWEPNPEADLAGYRVYRQPLDATGAAAGASIELTRALIATPAFRDLTAIAGQHYAYQVVAVDQAGNQSPPSARVLETSAH